MGGWRAALAALARPDRIAGLVLIAPALDFTEDLMWAQMGPEQRAILTRDGVLREPSEYSDEPYEYSLKLIDEGRRHCILKAGVAATARPDRSCPAGCGEDRRGLQRRS